jgi:vancomycin aglycone glucosyltransferase
MREMRTYIEEDYPKQARVLLEVGHDADVVVNAGLQLLGASVAATRGVPSAYVYYAPTMLPSATHAPPVLPWVTSSRLINLTLHALVRRFVFDGPSLPTLNAIRAGLKLAPVRSVAEALPDALWLGWDEALWPLADDVTPELERLGAHNRALVSIGAIPSPTAPLDDALTRFLDVRDDVIYVGFGSMPDASPHATLELVAQAAARLGVRVVHLSSWQGEVPAHVHVVSSCSHASLFPRMQALVHHGGAGTVAASARAGVPQVVVPFFVDQPFWANAVARAGIGVAARGRSKIDVDTLTRALDRALHEAPMRTAARDLGATLRATDPIARAIAALEHATGA